jgi:hypothetical protein
MLQGIINVKLPVFFKIRMKNEPKQSLLERMGNHVTPGEIEENLYRIPTNAVLWKDENTATLFNQEETPGIIRRHNCSHRKREFQLGENRFKGNLIGGEETQTENK